MRDRYMEELWKKKQSDMLRFLSRVRVWEYRQLPAIHRCTRPTRPDKARRSVSCTVLLDPQAPPLPSEQACPFPSCRVPLPATRGPRADARQVYAREQQCALAAGGACPAGAIKGCCVDVDSRRRYAGQPCSLTRLRTEGGSSSA